MDSQFSNSKRHATIKDVAAFAGVSDATVCVVLNGARSTSTKVGEATRARVIAAAEQLSYRRNGSMVAGRSGRFNCIGLLLSIFGSRSSLPSAVLQGILSELHAADDHLTLFRLPDDRMVDAVRSPKILREWMADGLIVDYTHEIPAAFTESLNSNQLPAVWYNAWLAHDTVRPDDEGASMAAARMLLEKGHQHVLYYDLNHPPQHVESKPPFPGTHYSVAHRYHGLVKGMTDQGCKVSTLIYLESLSFSERVLRIKELIRRDRITAVVFYSDIDHAVLQAIADTGLQVPRDISLLQFQAVPQSYHGMQITCMRIQEELIGCELVRMLRQKIVRPSTKIKPVLVPLPLVPGDTLGCVARNKGTA